MQPCSGVTLLLVASAPRRFILQVDLVVPGLLTSSDKVSWRGCLTFASNGGTFTIASKLVFDQFGLPRDGHFLYFSRTFRR